MPRTDTRAGIRSRYPNLGTNFRVNSRATQQYNCAAFAADVTDKRWWPWPACYWPVDHKCEESVDEFVRAFATLNYQPCQSATLEPGWEKIAIYAKGVTPASKKVKHVAKQTRTGKWKSKLGENEDIIHHAAVELCGVSYGNIVCIMRRPVRPRER